MISAPKQPEPLRNIGGPILQPFVLQPGFTENPQRPSTDFFCAAVSSVLDAKGETHKSYKWILRSDVVKRMRRQLAQKFVAIDRAIEKVERKETRQLRAGMNLKKSKTSFYRFA